jgi:hypothetical protein
MLATDLLLLALDDERGIVLPQAALGLDYGLAGAIVMELALHGRIRVDDDVVSVSGPASDDALLDDALRAIAAAPGKNLSHWVWHLSRDLGGLRQRLLDRLVMQGTLEKREKRVLLLFHRNVYPERDARVEHDPRHRCDLPARAAQGDQGTHRQARRRGHRGCERRCRTGGAGRDASRHRGHHGRDHGLDGGGDQCRDDRSVQRQCRELQVIRRRGRTNATTRPAAVHARERR